MYWQQHEELHTVFLPQLFSHEPSCSPAMAPSISQRSKSHAFLKGHITRTTFSSLRRQTKQLCSDITLMSINYWIFIVKQCGNCPETRISICSQFLQRNWCSAHSQGVRFYSYQPTLVAFPSFGYLQWKKNNQKEVLVLAAGPHFICEIQHLQIFWIS